MPRNVRPDWQDPDLARGLVKALESRLGQVNAHTARVMEVCGTHTVNIFRSGLRSLLPPRLELLSGPGCPVCVTPTGYIDHAIALARLPGLSLATFGDMIKVPGSESSLEKERAKGARVRIVYSVLDALAMARSSPAERVVFLGVGFETTAPTIASALLQARLEGLDNFFVLSAHKVIPPAMKALLADQEVAVDAFLCPGHVSTIIGAGAYETVARAFDKPCVVAGFEPLDVLQSLVMIVTQMAEGRGDVEVQYTRCVRWEGNERAQAVIREVFEPADTVWRGLGTLPGSGLAIRPAFAAHDAARAFDVEVPESRPDPDCRCGDVLRGVIAPPGCGLFGDTCTPDHPVGPCMVSSEGTCSAYFKYGRTK